MVDSLGDRMKVYERATQQTLTENLPIIIRLDGRCFHSLYKKLNRPFDDNLIAFMNRIALDLCENEIQNVQLAYIQSDEISLLIYKDTFATSWFGNRIQKMVSIASARASAYANTNNTLPTDRLIMFDARAFVLPLKDVCNYFIWRQKDWTKNSIQLYARSLYSHSQLKNKNCSDMQDMIFEKGYNWDKLSTYLKRGRCIYPEKLVVNDAERKAWVVDNDIPIFTEDREYVEKYLEE